MRAGFWPKARSPAPSEDETLQARVATSPRQESIELQLWQALEQGGVYEIVTSELVSSLARHIRAFLSVVTLHSLRGRTDLNGLEAEVIGPLDEESDRVPVRVRGTNERILVRPKNAFDGVDGGLPLVLELGAGNGVLCYCLGAELHGYARVVGVDDMSEPMSRAFGDEIEVFDGEAAIRQRAPALVLCSWMPPGVDWGITCRRCASVRALILLGDPACTGAAETWGGQVVEDEPGADGGAFELILLHDVAQFQVCRKDSARARGFSTAVAYRRRRRPWRQKAVGAAADPENVDTTASREYGAAEEAYSSATAAYAVNYASTPERP